MKEKNKNMIKALGTGMVLGGIITGGGVYAASVGASNVSYSNASSGLSATTAQGAIDSLASQANELKYFKYYYTCHMTTIDKSYFSSKQYNIRGAFSYDMIGQIYKNFLGSASTDSYIREFSSEVQSCCKSKSACGSDTGTCYSKCSTGYDSYFVTS